MIRFFLGSGVTAALIFRYLNPNIYARAYTNNLGAIDKAHGKALLLHLTGGDYQYESNLLVGPSVLESVNQVNVSKTFIGSECFSFKNGVTSRSVEIAAIERAMIKQTNGKVILVADHNKFNTISEHIIAPLRKIDVIITDNDITPEIHEYLTHNGIEVMVAN